MPSRTGTRLRGSLVCPSLRRPSQTPNCELAIAFCDNHCLCSIVELDLFFQFFLAMGCLLVILFLFFVACFQVSNWTVVCTKQTMQSRRVGLMVNDDSE